MKRLPEIVTLALFVVAIIATQFWMARAIDTGSTLWPAVTASIYLTAGFIGLLHSVFDPKATLGRLVRSGFLSGIVMTTLFVIGYGSDPEATRNFFGLVDAGLFFAIIIVAVLSFLERLNVGTYLSPQSASAGE